MTDVFALHQMDAVKVRVKKCDGQNTAVYKKFSIDPRITSFEVLRKLLSKAFNIRGEFSISYLARDEAGKPTYTSLLSDWDLDAALLGLSPDSHLRLKVDLQPVEEGYNDWDIICPVDLPDEPSSAMRSPSSSHPLSFRDKFISISKTMDMVTKALNLSEVERRYAKPPMTDVEYRNFLDSDGRLVRPLEFRRSVFLGGVDHNLRKYVWRLILNVFPDGLAGQERLDYMKAKSTEYYRIRDSWKARFSNGEMTHQLQFITNLVRKDVLRTDRTQKFYAGSDENKNVLALFNVLTTYAMTHPSVSYCQGMSDLASPLLVVMKDEAHAYICFCGLMKRMKRNFRSDGLSLTLKFDHLKKIIAYYDPEFHSYLVQNDCDELLFCYRWLLVELKREFAFEDALHILEVIWSSLPPDPPAHELELTEMGFFDEGDDSGLHFTRGDPRTTTSSKSSSGHSSGRPSKRGSVISGEGDDQSHSSSEDSNDYVLMSDSLTDNLEKQLVYLEISTADASQRCRNASEVSSSSADSQCRLARPSSAYSMDNTLTDSKVEFLLPPSNISRTNSDLSDISSLPSADASPTAVVRRRWPQSVMDSGVDASAPSPSESSKSQLPRPQELGDGNPFLIFLCATILLQQRDCIMSNQMQQHFELAMHFDKLIKRHNLHKILLQARRLFTDYLKTQQSLQDEAESHAEDGAHNF
ncbi:hypothetical protein RvY_05251 [Ramazzottius varieornatus]|uniref:Rab-GAP TBC domain-containing protein n=1 Tax=Ramazzottius varieornatus TaxID=947166 RepID=A0A1D1UUD7_RAMVA|nr:hypothetical protein RvY_05251 [Ramazzottius varieornatus]